MISLASALVSAEALSLLPCLASLLASAQEPLNGDSLASDFRYLVKEHVNLKKYFYSTTTSNFFSYITVSLDMRKEKSFEEILEIVRCV